MRYCYEKVNEFGENYRGHSPKRIKRHTVAIERLIKSFVRIVCCCWCWSKAAEKKKEETANQHMFRSFHPPRFLRKEKEKEKREKRKRLRKAEKRKGETAKEKEEKRKREKRLRKLGEMTPLPGTIKGETGLYEDPSGDEDKCVFRNKESRKMDAPFLKADMRRFMFEFDLEKGYHQRGRSAQQRQSAQIRWSAGGIPWRKRSFHRALQRLSNAGGAPTEQEMRRDLNRARRLRVLPLASRLVAESRRAARRVAARNGFTSTSDACVFEWSDDDDNGAAAARSASGLRVMPLAAGSRLVADSRRAARRVAARNDNGAAAARSASGLRVMPLAVASQLVARSRRAARHVAAQHHSPPPAVVPSVAATMPGTAGPLCDPRYCGGCGAPFPPYSKQAFCGNCGTPRGTNTRRSRRSNFVRRLQQEEEAAFDDLRKREAAERERARESVLMRRKKGKGRRGRGATFRGSLQQQGPRVQEGNNETRRNETTRCLAAAVEDGSHLAERRGSMATIHAPVFAIEEGQEE